MNSDDAALKQRFFPPAPGCAPLRTYNTSYGKVITDKRTAWLMSQAPPELIQATKGTRAAQENESVLPVAARAAELEKFFSADLSQDTVADEMAAWGTYRLRRCVKIRRVWAILTEDGARAGVMVDPERGAFG